MSNIIQAIYNIYHCPVYKTGEHYYAKNRANKEVEIIHADHRRSDGGKTREH